MKKQQISETSDVGRERSAVAAFGVLLERPRETGGNLVDAHSNLGGHSVDRTGDLSHELLFGGEIGNGLDLVLGQQLAFEIYLLIKEKKFHYFATYQFKGL